MKIKQRAELRIILQREDSYALLARVTIRDEDVYCGVHSSTGYELLRSSHHGTGGDRHPTGRKLTHVANKAKTIDDGPAVPPVDLKGLERIWTLGGDPEGLEWAYRPHPESARRHNFVIPIDELRVPCAVDIWLIQRGRPDIWVDMIKMYHADPVLRPVAFSKVIDWTYPQVWAIATTAKDEVVDSFEQFIVEQGLPPGGKHGAFLRGPGPAIGPPITVWPAEPPESS